MARKASIRWFSKTAWPGVLLNTHGRGPALLPEEKFRHYLRPKLKDRIAHPINRLAGEMSKDTFAGVHATP